MNKRIERIIEKDEKVPVSVYYCEVKSQDKEMELVPSVKLVVSKKFFTYKLFLNSLGKPISRLL